MPLLPNHPRPYSHTNLKIVLSLGEPPPPELLAAAPPSLSPYRHTLLCCTSFYCSSQMLHVLFCFLFCLQIKGKTSCQQKHHSLQHCDTGFHAAVWNQPAVSLRVSTLSTPYRVQPDLRLPLTDLPLNLESMEFDPLLIHYL